MSWSSPFFFLNAIPGRPLKVCPGEERIGPSVCGPQKEILRWAVRLQVRGSSWFLEGCFANIKKQVLSVIPDSNDRLHCFVRTFELWVWGNASCPISGWASSPTDGWSPFPAQGAHRRGTALWAEDSQLLAQVWLIHGSGGILLPWEAFWPRSSLLTRSESSLLLRKVFLNKLMMHKWMND